MALADAACGSSKVVALDLRYNDLSVDGRRTLRDRVTWCNRERTGSGASREGLLTCHA
jgi:hypothetical protein